MRRFVLALVSALALVAAGAGPALAHPLGNFTINRFSHVWVAGDRLRVWQVVDYAEIPAFQERQRGAGVPGYDNRLVRQVTDGLKLTVDGRLERLTPGARSLRFLPGQGGLDTMRLELELEGPRLPAGQHSVHFRDVSASDRIGWREIVATATGGARLEASSVPAASVSDELRRYPEDLLKNPLRVSEARLTVEPEPGASVGPGVFESSQVTRAVKDRFAALIGADQRPAAIAMALLVAIMLGALHALEPGHGKAVMAGYLVGTRGTPRHAALLALSITLTHTAGVFLLGLVVLVAAEQLAPERLYPWLSLLSGLLIIGVGVWLVAARLRGRAGAAHDLAGASHDHDHEHRHEHGHQHGHEHGRHLAAGAPGWSAVLLGISGGIVPCPSALVVLLAAVSLQRVGFGLALIAAFSAGLALTLTGVGLAVAGGRSTLGRIRWRPPAGMGLRLRQVVPLASAAVVTVAGVAMTVQAAGAVL